MKPKTTVILHKIWVKTMSERNSIFIIFFLLLLSPVILTAGPLRFAPQKLIQPNGDTVKCFASGNEFYHWLHDKEGYTIVFNPVSKYWVYAQKTGSLLAPTNYIAGKDNWEHLSLQKWLKPDKSILRARYESKLLSLNKKRAVIASESSITKGTINNIVVYIRFRDQQEFSEPLTFYQNKFDGISDTSFCLKGYYYSASYKQLTVASSFYPTPGTNSIVSFQDVHKRDYYRNKSVAGDSGYADADKGYERLDDLLKRSVAGIASQVPASLNIDADSNGKIDNVVFVVEGAPDGWDDVLWPFQDTAAFTAYINDKKVSSYNLQLSDELSASVLCHEMFHSLGAPDLYHYNNYSVPVGPWDLMEDDSGQNMTAYMKYRYGKWIGLPALLTQTGTYTLKPLGGTDTAGICYKIKSPNSAKEFFMLEYRNNTMKYDASLPASGIIIYRINTNYDGRGNEDGPPDELYIYRPNGTTSDDGDINSAAFSQTFSRTSFNDTTNPSCFLNSGAAGGISISEITVSGSTASIKFNSGTTTAEESNEIPNEFSLAQNYPNPFNPDTRIKFSLPAAAKVSVKIFDLLGREIKALLNGELSAGAHEVIWNGDDNSGQKAAAGVYMYSVSTGKFSRTKKMVLLK